MVNLSGGEQSNTLAVQCKHAPEMAPTLQLRRPGGEQLTLFACSACQHRWWQDDSEVVDLSVVLSMMSDIARHAPRRRSPKSDGPEERLTRPPMTRAAGRKTRRRKNHRSLECYSISSGTANRSLNIPRGQVRGRLPALVASGDADGYG
jgi:hypothetical protein